MWFWELNSDSHACAVWMMLTKLSPNPLCDYFIILFLFEIESRDLHVVSTSSITELYPADQLLPLNPFWPLRGRDHVLADSYGFSLPSVSLSCLPLKPGEVLTYSIYEEESIVPTLKRPKVP